MGSLKLLTPAGLLGAAVLGGCATVRPHEGFGDVERNVAAATSQPIRWNAGGDADRAVASRVDALLDKPLDAEAAVEVALLNNRRLQATYEELGVAQADLVGAGLLTNPLFNGSARFGQGTPSFDLDVAFNFLDVFFIPLREQIAAARLEATKLNVTAAVLGTVSEVKSAFYSLQAAQQQTDLRRQVVQATAASYDLAKRLREAGNNRRLDVAYEQALYEESRLALATAEADAVAAHERLGRLMGVWGPRANWTVAGRLPDPPAAAPPPGDLEKSAVESSLALRAARAQIMVARRELGITKPLGVLSDLEVGAAAEREDGDWQVGPSLALPLPIFSQGQPAVARARARLRQAEQNFYATAVDVRSQVRAGYARVQSLRQQAEHYRKVILPLRQAIVDDSQTQYNAMQVGPFQLLQAKRDQIAAAAAYLDVIRDYWAGESDLRLLLRGGTVGELPTSGEMTSRDMPSINATLAPGGH